MTMALAYDTLAHLCDNRIGVRDIACPLCGPERHSPINRKRRVLRVWHREPGFATYHCARCGERGYARDHDNGHRDAREVEALERLRKEAAERDAVYAARCIQHAGALWRQAAPLSCTLGWRYFTERRGLHIGVLDDLSHALRWHEGERAVIALMTDPLGNEPTGVHRTFLNADGTKRERKMLGHAGAIRLSGDEDVHEGLGLCEGIEDGLAVLLSGWAPVWAATCAGAIKIFPVLPGIESLTIFADCDVVGTEAAQLCARRWRANERDVSIEGI